MKATKFIYKVLVALLVSTQLFAATGCNEKSGSPKPVSEKDFKKIQLTENGEGLYVEYEGTKENLVIPSKIQDKPVLFVKIFDSKAKIKSVVIPEGVKYLGPVGGEALESVTLPKSIKFIHTHAFTKQDNLKEINIPEEGLSVFVYGLNSEYTKPRDCFTGKAIDNSVELQEKILKIKDAGEVEDFYSAREADYLKWFYDNLYPVTGGNPLL